MEANVRKSGATLALAGLAGGLFFWLTDPRWNHERYAQDVIDRVNEGRVGTLVGIVGSAVVLMIGIFLTTRRTT